MAVVYNHIIRIFEGFMSVNKRDHHFKTITICYSYVTSLQIEKKEILKTNSV